MSDAMVPAGSTALATTGSVSQVAARLAQMQAASRFNADAFSRNGGSMFSILPQLRLYAMNAKEVIARKVRGGDYGLYKKKGEPILDFGEEIVVVPIAWRTKAMLLNAKPLPLAYFKEDTAEYQNVVKLSAVKDSGAIYGPEYLVFIPPIAGKLDAGIFAACHMASTTNRNASGELQPYLPDVNGKFYAAKLGSAVVERKDPVSGQQQSWLAMKAATSNQIFELPSDDQLDTAIRFFLNPKDSEAQEAEADTPTAASGTVNNDR